MSRHFWDGEDWCPLYRLMGLGSPDQDLKMWGSHEDVPPAGVPTEVELGSRMRHHVRLPEHGKETEGEAHPQGRTEGLQAVSDGAEAK